MKVMISKRGIVSTAERQQMWMAELNRKHILYFGCHSGLGKTCQAEYLAEENYCYWCTIDAEQPAVYARMEQWLKDISGKNARKLVIITNTTYLKEFGQNLQDVMQIINRKIDLNDSEKIISEAMSLLENPNTIIPSKRFYVDLDEEILKNLKILLGPKVTQAQEEIVKLIVKEYCPTAKISRSKLKIS